MGLKIALVIERIEAWRGGQETSTMEQARLLADRGHDIHVVTASRSPSPPNLTIHMISAASVLRPLRSGLFLRRAEAFIREHRFDLVHAISPLATADLYQPRGGLVKETLERNVALRPTASRRMAKRALQAMNYKHRRMLELEGRIMQPGGPIILCVSNYVAEQCRRHYGLGGPRVRVVFNGVTVNGSGNGVEAAEIRRQYGVAQDATLLLFVAHNFRLKGLLPLLSAVRMLVREGRNRLHLLVVGRDNLVRYQRRVDALGLDPYVTFTGPTQRASTFYHAADVCVLPSYYDPCSRVVLEALSVGLPCITTRFNGASEVMTDGGEGYILDTPDDVERMAECLRKLQDRKLRQAMSARALLLRDRVSMVRHVEGLDRVYREVGGK